MAASGKSRWGRRGFQNAALICGRLRGGRGCSLEVDVRPHIAENPGGLNLQGNASSRRSGLSVAHAWPTCGATAARVGERRG